MSFVSFTVERFVGEQDNQWERVDRGTFIVRDEYEALVQNRAEEFARSQFAERQGAAGFRVQRTEIITSTPYAIGPHPS